MKLIKKYKNGFEIYATKDMYSVDVYALYHNNTLYTDFYDWLDDLICAHSHLLED